MRLRFEKADNTRICRLCARLGWHGVLAARRRIREKRPAAGFGRFYDRRQMVARSSASKGHIQKPVPRTNPKLLLMIFAGRPTPEVRRSATLYEVNSHLANAIHHGNRFEVVERQLGKSRIFAVTFI